MPRSARWAGFCAIALLAVTTTVRAAAVLLESLNGRQVFPVNNWWNLDVSLAPVDPRSAQFIAWISGRTGGNTDRDARGFIPTSVRRRTASRTSSSTAASRACR